MPSLLNASPISSAEYVELVRPLALRRFDIFFNHIFRDSVAAVEGKFIPGAHFDEWARRQQASPKTATISARKHGKTLLYAQAWLAWRVFRTLHLPEAPAFEEWLFLSYSQDLAQYHLKKLKQYLSANPWFAALESLTDAESILRYRAPELPGTAARPEISVEPAGIFTFKRGRHPHGVIADDILRDPEKRLDLTQIAKITRIFKDEVISMPKEGGWLHVVGTPQDTEDLFAELRGLKAFDVAEYPAMVDEARRVALWPQMFPFERLEEIRDLEIGRKSFLKEYQCHPTREVSGYFDAEELDRIIDPALTPLDPFEPITGRIFVGGQDLGKKSHPSHLVIFEEVGEELVQRLSRWFDRTDYTEQVEHLRAYDRLYGLAGFCYDDTRQELESFKEKQELPACATGVALTAKEQHELGARFGNRVRCQRIRLLPDPRQRRSLLSVDDNLDAPVTADGHGDAFWSVALAVKAAESRTSVGLTVFELGRRREEVDE